MLLAKEGRDTKIVKELYPQRLDYELALIVALLMVKVMVKTSAGKARDFSIAFTKQSQNLSKI